MALRTLDSLGSLAGKRVIVRCDLNVPLKDGVITDDGRVRASLPTLNALINQGARVIVCSHLGRPDGAPDPKYSLEPVAQRLSELLGKPVAFARDTVGESAHEAVAALEDGDVAVIENLRFNPGETAKDDAERGAFAAQLAELGDALVSDGFGVVHRKQASVYDLAEILPSAAGFLIEKEVDVLDRLTENPERPYTVVLGGSKVSDKLGVIEHLLPRVDRLLVGGGMMFTFLAAEGHKVGASLLEQDQLDTVKGYIATAKERGVELVLPVDAVVAASFSADAEHVVAPAPSDRGHARSARRAWASTSAPRRRQQFADVDPRLEDRVLERPDGRVRDGGVRGGHQDGRAGAHRGRRPVRRRRRRLGRRGAPARVRRRRVRSHLDRRRREPRVPRRQEASRTGGPRMAAVSRTPLIAGNWKMNLDHLQAVAFVQKLHWALKDAKHEDGSVEVAVFPPFTDLRTVQTLIDADKIPFALGAQDLSAKDSGAYTGEISGAFLAKLDCRYVIIGHSERREYHAESDEVVAAKVQAALRHGLVPVICVGETAEDLEKFGASAVPVGQLQVALEGVPPDADIVVAYEPVWAIGSGQAATPEQAQDVCAKLRDVIAEKLGPDAAARTRVLYGGSVKSANIASFMREPDVDGALVGGASLVVDEFAAIIRYQKHVGV